MSIDVTGQQARQSSRLRRAPRVANARRALLISYHFPPVGGAGVQRPAKFAKYLGRFGWDVSVLVAENPSVPVLDASLVGDIPANVVIERAKTLEPGYWLKKSVATGAAPEGRSRLVPRAKQLCMRPLRWTAGAVLQPDAQVLWSPAALRSGGALLERMPHDVLVATAPAYTNLLIGALLKMRYGLPLVLDFRDEWDISLDYLENSRRDRLARAMQARMQRFVLSQADAIVATTRASAQRLEERARAAGSRAEVSCIYNGFDEDDFIAAPKGEGEVEAPREGGFRLVYTGTLWNLTSVKPLVRAIEQIDAVAPELLERLELVFVGRKTPEQQNLLSRMNRTRCRVRVEDYCDHTQALAWMRSADALCVLLSDVRDADRVVPAKLFEYIAMRKEILAITPDGEASDIIHRVGVGHHMRPGDIDGIVRWLRERLSKERTSAFAPGSEEAVGQFSRERLCGQLASILDGLVQAS